MLAMKNKCGQTNTRLDCSHGLVAIHFTAVIYAQLTVQTPAVAYSLVLLYSMQNFSISQPRACARQYLSAVHVLSLALNSINSVTAMRTNLPYPLKRYLDEYSSPSTNPDCTATCGLTGTPSCSQ
jgi:hypothetical protein